MIHLCNHLPGPATPAKAIGTSLAVHTAGLLVMATWVVDTFSEQPRFSGRTSSSSLVIQMAVPEPEQAESFVAEGPVLITPSTAQVADRRYVDVASFELPAQPLEQIMAEALRNESAQDARPAPLVAARSHSGDDPGQPSRRPTPSPQVRRATLASRPQLAGTDEKTPPDFRGNRPPRYPSLAQQRGWEGTVLLQLVIAADGRVTHVEVVRSSGYAVLDAAAASAVRSWHGEPALRGGLPVETVEELPVRFSLSR